VVKSRKTQVKPEAGGNNKAKPDDAPPLAYRVRPLCKRLGISHTTFYKYLSAGRIKVVRIGNRTLVPASEVERLLQEGC
jgi:excisionase family DNA binding protein